MKVISFSKASFAEALVNSYSNADVIRNKRHFTYFIKYLGPDGLSARTMVIEDEYVSKDYLHDYASYYAFCFQHYDKFCRRVHFFDEDFSATDLQTALLNPTEEELWKHYLGFIVVKPIPVTVVGYTVLKVYPDKDHSGLRHFWSLRDYKIHFFGKELILNSLAFQEQDSVLAACATTAIWCMLNKASIDFHTKLKVPSEITRDAAALSNDGSRLFPNKGLDVLQICQAINNSGLAPEVWGANIRHKDASGKWDHFVTTAYLKRILYAYEMIGIPIILGIKVPTPKGYGYHAVTVSGHKMMAESELPATLSGFNAEKIEKIYVHDDQFGPFAWVKFMNDGVGIESPWTTDHKKKWPTYVVNVIVSLYPKIRISYDHIEMIVIGLDGILRRAFKLPDTAAVFWDIKLNYSEDFKRHVTASSIDNEEKIMLIEKSMPKYIWVATCYFGEQKAIEFTFDATDVNNGMLGLDVICFFDPDVKQHLFLYIKEQPADLATLFQSTGGNAYIQHLLDQLG